MRATEFTINIPINIKINGDGKPEISVNQDEPELDQNPVMVPPLQQHIELAKAEQGKKSPVIDKLTSDDSIGADDKLLDKIKQLAGR